MASSDSSSAANGSAQKIGIPRPAAPGAISDPLRQDVSFYKSLRSVVDVLNQQQGPVVPGAGSVTFYGKITPATDGKPGTFTQGSLDAELVRVCAAGQAAALGLTYEWVAGGGQTAVGHTLGRVPVGWIVCRINGTAQIFEGSNPWTTTTIYLNTTHSDEDAILLIF